MLVLAPLSQSPTPSGRAIELHDLSRIGLAPDPAIALPDRSSPVLADAVVRLAGSAPSIRVGLEAGTEQ
jgi:hypothetical protein